MNTRLIRSQCGLVNETYEQKRDINMSGGIVVLGKSIGMGATGTHV